MGRSGMKNNVSMAAHVPWPYKKAGNGSVWDVDDYIKMVPSGRNLRESSYQVLMLATASALDCGSTRPSLCNFLPMMPLRATGSLYSLGMTPERAKMIYLCSNMNPPQHSPMIMKSEFSNHNFLHSFMKKGLGYVSMLFEFQYPWFSLRKTTSPFMKSSVV